MFAAWGKLVHRLRWGVLVVVVGVTVLAGAWGAGVFDRLAEGGYDDPNSEAVHAGQVVRNALGQQSGDVLVVYTAPGSSTVDDPALAGRVRAALHALPADAVAGQLSYWDTGQPQFADHDHHRGLAVLTLTGGDDQNAKAKAYTRIADTLDVAGVRTQVGGQIPIQKSMSDHSTQDLTHAEAISLPVVLVLLVIIFGGVLAAALPVLVGGLAILGSLGVLHAISLGTDVNSFAVNVASLLGLGLAIDYGLFTVGRFREELAAGRDRVEAVRRTVATSGRTVAFSATLLVIALAGLMLFPQNFLKSLAYGGMSAVAVAAVVSLTLLPALLGILGHRVDKLSVPWRRKRSEATEESPAWRRLARAVMRRPLLVGVPIVALLVVLGAPFLSIRFGQIDQRALPADDPARQAIEVLDQDFPAMSGNSVQVVLQGQHGTPPAPAEVRHFAAEVGKVGGIDGVQPAGAGNDVVLFRAGLAGEPLSEQSRQAVTDIRHLDRPAGTTVLVGGVTAKVGDSLAATRAQLPWMGLLLVGATVLLMFLAFGSVLLPIKAVVMSVLSLSATFGVLVWVFQEGHGAGLLGVTPMPMEAGLIVLMASVVFGLSTDYEVFLLSRMVEARAKGASTEEAVTTGIARTGRVISAAALLLIVVTGAFALSQITVMRFIGVGMILALALDATVVRLLLVPAVLRLLGRAAWWAPGPLRRLQERVGIAESADPDEPAHPARRLEHVG